MSLVKVYRPEFDASPKQQPWLAAVHAFKRALLQTTLEAHGGNRPRAARALGLTRPYFARLMSQFCVEGPPPPKGRDRFGHYVYVALLALLLTGCAVAGTPTAYRVHEGRGEVILSDPWGRK